jgi:hypothetical protein
LKAIPAHLAEHVLPFNWDVRRVWEQTAEASVLPRVDFDYLLNLSLWSSVPSRGMLFDISPREVIAFPQKSPHQYRRILEAKIEFPIDLLSYRGRQWILDGVHRLAKLALIGGEVVSVRCHPETIISKITTQAEQGMPAAVVGRRHPRNDGQK